MKRFGVALLMCVVMACGNVRAAQDDAALPDDASVDASPALDAGVDAEVDARLPPEDERASMHVGDFVGGAGTIKNSGNQALTVDIVVGDGFGQTPVSAGSTRVEPGMLQGEE